MDGKQQDVTDLWVEYSETKDPKLRETLILHYTSLVKYVVSRLALRLPRSLEYDDLVSFGVVVIGVVSQRFGMQNKEDSFWIGYVVALNAILS